MKDIDSFIQQVKLNCNISGAKFWGYYCYCRLYQGHPQAKKIIQKMHIEIN